MRRIGIVGCGIAAATATTVLHRSALETHVTILEATDRIGGRAATATMADTTVDYGANYVDTDDERVEEVLRSLLTPERIATIPDPVWTFDEAGTIEPGDAPSPGKWTPRDGLRALTRSAIEAAQPTLLRETPIERLQRAGDRWSLIDDAGTAHGPFDDVLLTPPAPELAAVLERSSFRDRDTLLESLRPVTYRPVTSAVLGYPFRLSRPYYALLNTDRNHDVGWIAREECKPGHVPDGRSCLVV